MIGSVVTEPFATARCVDMDGVRPNGGSQQLQPGADVKILFFGKLGDLVGREVDLDVPTGRCSVSELRRVLASRYPQAHAELMKPSLRACVIDMLVGEDFEVGAATQVEFLPPLSGG